MKRNTLIIAALFVAGTVMSQDLTSKKGELYTPEAGEYSIGIDASPLLNYFGNFIGGDGLNTAPVFRPHGEDPFFGEGMSHSIYGKMMIDANSAYRANVRIGFNNETDRMDVQDATPGAAAESMVENKTKNGDFGITLGLGKEYRRGNTRLQGVYGAMAQLGFASQKTKTEYGNDIQFLDVGDDIENKSGSIFNFGLNAFGGVEYFFAPKMSIGGEYTFGINFRSQGKSSITEIALDDNGDNIEETTDGTTSSSKFGFDTGLVGGGSLKLQFYF